MPFPKIPDNLRSELSKVGLEMLYRWLAQDLLPWAQSRMDTTGDITTITPGNGLVLTNKAGTITKRLYLKDDGSGPDVENV